MTDVTTENSGFIKIVDTIYDSKILAGLVSSGVLPATFRVIKGSITFDNTAVGHHAIIDSASGNQVHIEENQVILYAAAYGVEVDDTGAPLFNVNLAATAASGTGSPASTPITSLFNDGTDALLTAAQVNAGILGLNPVTGTQPVSGLKLITNATGNWVQVSTTVATTASGSLNVILVIV